jgi:hypothetical protein
VLFVLSSGIRRDLEYCFAEQRKHQNNRRNRKLLSSPVRQDPRPKTATDDLKIIVYAGHNEPTVTAVSIEMSGVLLIVGIIF